MFFGVHKFAPILAIQGDMGWVPGVVQRKCEMIRLWNRLIKMEEDRVNKRVFSWGKAHRSPWVKEIYSIFEEVDMLYIYRNNLSCNVNSLKHKLLMKYEEKWFENVLLKPKLRTYMHIKQNFSPELYVTSRLPRSQRSLVAQLRCGILPLAIEVGRFKNTPEENRLCVLCDLGEVENESHFLLYCTHYDDLRESLFLEVKRQISEIFWYADDQKLLCLFNYDVFKFANFVSKAWKRRQASLFN